ncbi:MAG: hypothetical protein U1F58_02255 [Burkholderiales bacterium]
MKRVAATVIVLGVAVACTLPPAHAAAGRRAEVQVALCGDPDAIARALDLRSRAAPYQTWLFDDDALTLHAQGLRLRLRVRADGAELTLKAADQPCTALPPALVPRRQGKCEYDVHGDRMTGAVSISATLDAAAWQALVAGRVAPADALSDAQVRFLREATAAWPLPPGLRPLGPIATRALATPGGRYDVDAQQLPNGRQFVEMSARVSVSEAPAAQRALHARIERAGVAACADQAAQAGEKLRALLPPR